MNEPKNKIIKKDIVSYDIAVFLFKQCEFNEPCCSAYKNADNLLLCSSKADYSNRYRWGGECIIDDYIAAPTITHALEFLNKHFIFKIHYKQEINNTYSFKIINPYLFNKILISENGLKTKRDILQKYIDFLTNSEKSVCTIEELHKARKLSSEYRQMCDIKKEGLCNAYFWPDRLEKRISEIISEEYNKIINEIKELNSEWKPNYE